MRTDTGEPIFDLQNAFNGDIQECMTAWYYKQVSGEIPLNETKRSWREPYPNSASMADWFSGVGAGSSSSIGMGFTSGLGLGGGGGGRWGWLWRSRT